jgi:hypothetical protein
MDEQIIEGKWWIHGPEAAAQFGTFTSHERNGLSLVVKVPECLSVDETMWQSLNAGGDSSVPVVLLGRDGDNKPVTLFGCHALPSIRMGLKTYNVDVLAAVRGLELTSWSEKCIHAASLDINQLHGWLGGDVVEFVKTPNENPSLRPALAADVIVDVCADLQVRIVRFIATSWSQTEYRFSSRPRLWLHFRNAQSVSDVADRWVPWVTRLFSLLIGEPVSCKTTELYQDDPYNPNAKGLPTEGTLIRHGKRRETGKPVHTINMLAPYPGITGDFANIVRSWSRVASELAPVVDLFSTVAFHNRLHGDAEFLFLVQALEVYHARLFDSKILSKDEHAQRVGTVVNAAPPELREWAQRKLQSANYKYLDERIAETFERHRGEAQRLFTNLDELPEKIRYTRNYLTHYNAKIDSPKYLNDVDMIRATWYLRVFLWVCLLKEIGVPGDAIDRLIRRHEDLDFVTL